MKKYTYFTIISLLIILINFSPAIAQNNSVPDEVSTRTFYDTLRNQRWWFEVDLLLNPIYISQLSSKYSLNGHRLSVRPGPRFYGVLPTQIAFSDFGETADQSNAIYFHCGPWFDKSALTFLHNTRFVFGVTHDKLETGSSSIYYKFPDGGTELTVMLDKNIPDILPDLDFKSVNLIFNFNVQAGLFASVAGVKANMKFSDTTIESVSNSRWQWPVPGNGWGWLVSTNAEVGGVLCHEYFISQKFTANCWLGKGLFGFFKHIGFTVGARVMVEGLNSSTDVTVQGVSGYRLKASNYGLFFTGPVINLKYIKF